MCWVLYGLASPAASRGWHYVTRAVLYQELLVPFIARCSCLPLAERAHAVLSTASTR